MNQSLMASYTEDEIVEVLKGMGPTKASGLDVANRLKKVLDVCIDDSQSAFVLGRLITNNLLLVYEILHSFKDKRSGRKGFMALKLNMSKTYDRVE
ncbi:reverse transcriptase [Gossypium australe]|uniref:Reverse transcriptase n=1 Tax=Gossypium australe TaxID=47621 RepID=A0A5B6VKX7_9ROSI|nr:reverse transcriptase [Gossypium australe]